MSCATLPRVFLLCALLASLPLAVADDVIPADAQPQWFKGNLHTHTLWSDGNDFPEMVAEWYRTHDYHFLALSDHNILSEGIKWYDVARLQRKEALDKYIARFGNDWVETQGAVGAAGHRVRLKPLNEFRALVEERGKFIMLSSEEISARAGSKPIHMNATNLKERLPALNGQKAREVIAANLRAVEEQAKKTGREMMVHLNHPNFGYAVTAEDLAAVIGERFFEVYNGHPGINHHGKKDHPPVEELWDIANTLRIGQLAAPALFGIATDDSHTYHGGNVRPGRGWVMVRARHLTPESLIRAMKRGDFYASSGVTLREVRYDAKQGELHLEIEPAGAAKFTTRFIGTPVGYDAESKPRLDEKGQPIETTRLYSADVGKVFATVEGTTASFKLTGKELYVRAVVTSDQAHDDPSFAGQKKEAWTQPVGWQQHVKE